jgi:hypothetical protein
MASQFSPFDLAHLATVLWHFLSCHCSPPIQLALPPEIKRYASGFEMCDAEREHHFRLHQFGEVRETVQSLYKSLSKLERSNLPFREPEYNVHADNAVERLSQFLVHQWTVRNIQSAWLRIVIFLLFSAGLALLAIPAILTFVQVTLIPMKRMSS